MCVKYVNLKDKLFLQNQLMCLKNDGICEVCRNCPSIKRFDDFVFRLLWNLFVKQFPNFRSVLGLLLHVLRFAAENTYNSSACLLRKNSVLCGGGMQMMLFLSSIPSMTFYISSYFNLYHLWIISEKSTYHIIYYLTWTYTFFSITMITLQYDYNIQIVCFPARRFFFKHNSHIFFKLFLNIIYFSAHWHSI